MNFATKVGGHLGKVAGGPRALAVVDEVAYLRFASVYKGFEGVDDFRREVGLLTKTTAPKRPGG